MPTLPPPQPVAPSEGGVRLHWAQLPPELSQSGAAQVTVCRAFEVSRDARLLGKVDCWIVTNAGGQSSSSGSLHEDDAKGFSVVVALVEPRLIRLKIHLITKDLLYESLPFWLVTRSPELRYRAGVDARSKVALQFEWTPLAGLNEEIKSCVECWYRFVRIRPSNGSVETLCETTGSSFQVTLGKSKERAAFYKFLLLVGFRDIERSHGAEEEDGMHDGCAFMETPEQFGSCVHYYRNPPRPELVHGDSSMLRFVWRQRDLENLSHLQRLLRVKIEIVLEYVETNAERLRIEDDVNAKDFFEKSSSSISLKSLEEAIEFRDLLPGSRLLLRAKWRVRNTPIDHELGQSLVGVYATAAIRPEAPRWLDADHRMYEGSVRRYIHLYLHLRWSPLFSGGAPVRYYEVERLDGSKSNPRWTRVFSGDSTQCVLSAVCPRNKPFNLGYYFRIRTVTVAGYSEWTTNKLHIRSQTLQFIEDSGKPQKSRRKKQIAKEREEKLRQNYAGYLQMSGIQKQGSRAHGKRSKECSLERGLTKSGWMTHSYRDMLTASMECFRTLPSFSASTTAIERPGFQQQVHATVAPPKAPLHLSMNTPKHPKHRFNSDQRRLEPAKSSAVLKKLREDGIAWTYSRSTAQVAIPNEDKDYLRAREVYQCHLLSNIIQHISTKPNSASIGEKNSKEALGLKDQRGKVPSTPQRKVSIVRLESAIICLQYHVRKSLRSQRIRREAAVKVQTIARGRQCRKLFQRKVALVSILKRVSAKKIQRQCKLHLTRIAQRRRQRLIQSSICVQAQWRGHCLRQVRQQMEVERVQVDLAATSIQSAFRQIQAKQIRRRLQREETMRQELTVDSAEKIQSIYRGVRARLAAKKRKESIVKIQQKLREMKSKKELEKRRLLTLVRAAVRMQKVYRSYKIQGEFERRKRMETYGMVHVNVVAAGHSGCNGTYEIVSLSFRSLLFDYYIYLD